MSLLFKIIIVVVDNIVNKFFFYLRKLFVGIFSNLATKFLLQVFVFIFFINLLFTLYNGGNIFDAIINVVFNFSLSEPVFFYCGALFFLTTFLSYFFLSYLGLYGVFYINFFSIILF